MIQWLDISKPAFCIWRGLARTVEAASCHSLALTSDGKVFSWGWGLYGQLGYRSDRLYHLQAFPREVDDVNISRQDIENNSAAFKFRHQDDIAVYEKLLQV